MKYLILLFFLKVVPLFGGKKKKKLKKLSKNNEIYENQVTSSGEYVPVLVAAGGGGLGLGKFFNDGFQHGRGFLTGKPVSSAGNVTGSAAGKNFNDPARAKLNESVKL